MDRKFLQSRTTTGAEMYHFHKVSSNQLLHHGRDIMARCLIWSKPSNKFRQFISGGSLISTVGAAAGVSTSSINVFNETKGWLIMVGRKISLLDRSYFSRNKKLNAGLWRNSSTSIPPLQVRPTYFTVGSGRAGNSKGGRAKAWPGWPCQAKPGAMRSPIGDARKDWTSEGMTGRGASSFINRVMLRGNKILGERKKRHQEATIAKNRCRLEYRTAITYCQDSVLGLVQGRDTKGKNSSVSM